jgi:glycosyltransferase 2 family protein
VSSGAVGDVASDGGEVVTRLGGWRRRLFRGAAEGDLRRRTRDWARLTIAVVLLVLSVRHATDVTPSERALFTLFNTLPESLEPLFAALYRLGALWAVAMVVVAAIVGRRWGLARDLLVAGVVAWLSARALGQIVIEHLGVSRSVRAAASFGGGFPSFPAVRIAVIVAVISAARPYVTRPLRVFGRCLVVVVSVSALYLGAATPNEVFAGVVLGWGVGALVHLVFGSPGVRPRIDQVVAALAELGIEARGVRLARRQPEGSTVFLADHSDGPLRVKVIGRDEADAQLLEKLWRWLLYKDSGPRLSFTRVQQVEHEAYIMFAARKADVNVPEVVVAGSAGSRAALLVQRPVIGSRLSALAPDTVTDELLVGIWENVHALQRASIVHGDLDADHVIVADSVPWLVGFDAAITTASAHDRSRDVAELLVATSSIVGEARAVRIATGVLGRPKIAAALPLLQPAALTSSNRALIGEGRRELVERLERLREAAARAAGIEPPDLTKLHRISITSAAMAVGALVAIAALLSDIDDPTHIWATLRHAQWSWMGFAFALSLLANVPYAIALQGTVPIKLPLLPTSEVQLGMSFTNLAVPAIGGQGMQVRFLQKMGVDLSSAVAAGGILSTFGALVAAAMLFAIGVVTEPARVDLSLIPAEGLLTVTIGVAIAVAAASAVVTGIPILRRVVMPPIRHAASTMSEVLRSPHHLSLLIGGNILAALVSTWCLIACLTAFHGHAPFWAVLAANVAVMTIASTVPIPGGGTAVGTVGLSAVLVSFGVRKDIAVAAVLANQLAFYYLPAIPGWFATRHLIHNDYL